MTRTEEWGHIKVVRLHREISDVVIMKSFAPSLGMFYGRQNGLDSGRCSMSVVKSYHAMNVSIRL